MATNTGGCQPPNVLDRFSSHSYHHYLMVANNTEVFREMSTDKTSLSALSKLRAGQTYSAASDGKQTGSVVMVINSLVESLYTVESITYDTRYGGTANEGQQILTSALKMVIRETTGTRFMNFLKDISDITLKTDFSGMVFVLKTFFVGHLPNGETETIELHPISLILLGLNASFDQTGGMYDLEFRGLSNGVATSVPKMRYIYRNKTHVAPDGKLGTLVESITKNLNDELKIGHDSIGKGRPVKYQIEIPEHWKQFEFKGISDNFEEQTFPKEQSAQNPPPDKDTRMGAQSIDSGPKMAIDKFLIKVLSKCPGVYRLTEWEKKSPKEKKSQGDVRLYKIQTCVTSSDTDVTVHYDIVEYFCPKLPKNKNETKLFGREWFLDDKQSIPRYGMILDYFFTGRNSQVLGFDMNFKEGIVFLNTRRDSNKAVQGGTGYGTTSAVADARGNTKQPEQKTEIKSVNYSPRENDPIFSPESTKEQTDGNDSINGQKDVQKRQKFLNDNENMYGDFMTANVKIRGNPRLLNQTIKPMLPHDEAQYRAALSERAVLAKQTVDGGNDSQIKQGMSEGGDTATPNGNLNEHYPMFVKMNIRQPAINGEDFSEPFWYDGWYWISKVVNNFSNGTFEQDLELKAYRVYGTESGTGSDDG